MISTEATPSMNVIRMPAVMRSFFPPPMFCDTKVVIDKTQGLAGHGDEAVKPLADADAGGGGAAEAVDVTVDEQVRNGNQAGLDTGRQTEVDDFHEQLPVDMQP